MRNVKETFESIRSDLQSGGVYESRPDKKYEKKLEKKWARFGIDLLEDEQVLFALPIVDILATNQNLYLGSLDRPLPLEDIYTVTSPGPNLLNFMAGGQKNLIINGEPVFRTDGGLLSIKYLTPMLEGLGEARREELAKSGPLAPGKLHLTAAGPVTRPAVEAAAPSADLPRIAASAVCAKRSEDEILGMLSKAGADDQTARRMIAFMQDAESTPDRTGGLLMVLLGCGLFAAATGIGIFFANADLGFTILPKGLGALGIFVVLGGLIKVVTGNNDLAEDDLILAWSQSESGPVD